MRDARIRAGAIALVATCLVACTSSSSGGSASAQPPGVPSGPLSAAPASTDVSAPADVLDPIVADAATRAGVGPEAVTVTAATAQTWPNGALGCPQPGTAYTQAIVRGWQVIVEAGGTRYDYRSSGPGRFRLCTSG